LNQLATIIGVVFFISLSLIIWLKRLIPLVQQPEGPLSTQVFDGGLIAPPEHQTSSLGRFNAFRIAMFALT
jgi:hypothetical protein